MNVFVIGLDGRVGRLLGERLRQGGDAVAGLVGRHDDGLTSIGVRTHLGDVATMPAHALAAAIDGADAVVDTAEWTGGQRSGSAQDRSGEATTVDAAVRAGTDRFVLVSGFPEAWRVCHPSDDRELALTPTKRAEVALVQTDLDWLVLRPSPLTDGPPSGRVALGPAELREHVSRHDVAATVASLLHEPRIGRQILELNRGDVPIDDAVGRCALRCRPDGRRSAGRIGRRRASGDAPSPVGEGLWFDPQAFATTLAPPP